ncbi:MAG: hypothetical protein MRY74_09985 [Neomegalonema sp.]|nr:hypothetical protein [Neomegalonema sp.]
MPPAMLQLAIGALLCLITLLVALAEWSGAEASARAASILFLPLMAILARYASWSRRLFALIAATLAIVAISTRSDWVALIDAGLRSAALIVAFLTALSTLRSASASSRTMQECGAFLARQPPGRRYAALTAGGHLFGLPLNYGALALLGGMAEAEANREPNPEIRGHRRRRMLLAVQRGMISTLTWSPLAFSTAITTSIVPGASWAQALAPCLASSLIILAIGLALDTLFKPRLSQPAPPIQIPSRGWGVLWPLVGLLAFLMSAVVGLHLVSGVRVVAIVILMTPIFSVLWIAAQTTSGRRAACVTAYAQSFVGKEAPQLSNEVLLLAAAGFIGVVGSRLLSPIVTASGIDLTAIGGWPLLVAIVWLIPLAGQVGMNPILAVSLFGPMLPPAADVGLAPTDLIIALTAGWAISGASSPFTASTMLVGRMGQVSAAHVGVRWNGLFTLTCAAALSLWACVWAAMTP